VPSIMPVMMTMASLISGNVSLVVERLEPQMEQKDRCSVEAESVTVSM